MGTLGRPISIFNINLIVIFINILSGEKKFTEFAVSDSENKVSMFIISGIYKFNRRDLSIDNHTIEDGLLANTIYDIEVDEKNNMWAINIKIKF